MNLPLRDEEAAIITVALGILDLLLFKSRYPLEIQDQISERCKELIERIHTVRNTPTVVDDDIKSADPETPS